MQNYVGWFNPWKEYINKFVASKFNTESLHSDFNPESGEHPRPDNQKYSAIFVAEYFWVLRELK